MHAAPIGVRVGATGPSDASVGRNRHDSPQLKETLVMKTTPRVVLALGLFALTLAPVYGAVITKWDFENPPDPIAVNNSPAPTIGAGTAKSMGMNVYPTPAVGVTTCDVLAGVAGDTGGNGNGDTSQIWRVRAQSGGNGWSSAAPIGTQGAVFAASTAGFNAINVSFDWYATNQGEAKLQLEYTTDGVNFTNVPIVVPATDTQITPLVNAVPGNTVVGAYVWGSPTGQGQNWFPGLTALISDPAAANNPNFAIEMVNAATDGDTISMLGGSLNNTSGNWRFDNITISGTAVPEPQGIVLACISAVGLLVLGGRQTLTAAESRRRA
jgi:hypothetical protein